MGEILILDNDPELTSIYRRILETEGYHVVGVTTGVDAIDVMRNDRPDLVLLNEMMAHGLEGIDVSREVAADPDLKSIPIIAILPNATSEHPPNDDRAAFSARIPRLPQPTALLATIRQFVS